MELQPIPNTQLSVSTICLGTMTFGRPVAEAEAIRIVHQAIDNGINFIDTADIYEGYDRFLGSPGGVAEAILGKALEGRRQQVVITTKVGNPVGGGGYDGGGLGHTHISHQIDASLQRLQTDYVDFYELHRPDPKTPLDESLAVIEQLIVAGKVRHWGFSNFDATQIREMIVLCDANGWPRPVISQPPYSWLTRDVEAEHLPVCREYEIAVTPYKPLEGGLLTGKYQRGQRIPPDSRATEIPNWIAVPDDAMYSRLEEYEKEAQAAGLKLARYALRWLLDQPGVCSVVVGIRRIEQLEGLLKT